MPCEPSRTSLLFSILPFACLSIRRKAITFFACFQRKQSGGEFLFWYSVDWVIANKQQMNETHGFRWMRFIRISFNFLFFVNIYVLGFFFKLVSMCEQLKKNWFSVSSSDAKLMYWMGSGFSSSTAMSGAVFKLSEYKRMLPPVDCGNWKRIRNESNGNNVRRLTVGNFQNHFRWPIQIYHVTFEHFAEYIPTSFLPQNHTHILPESDH